MWSSRHAALRPPDRGAGPKKPRTSQKHEDERTRWLVRVSGEKHTPVTSRVSRQRFSQDSACQPFRFRSLTAQQRVFQWGIWRTCEESHVWRGGEPLWAGGGGGASVCAPLVLRPLNRLEVDALLHHLPQRRHLAQALDVLDAILDRVIDLGLGGEAADAEAY